MIHTRQLGRIKEQIISQVIRSEIDYYIQKHLKIKVKRDCSCGCGNQFYPLNRYHFFSSQNCRKKWYSGWFRPSRKMVRSRKKRAA